MEEKKNMQMTAKASNPFNFFERVVLLELDLVKL